MNDILNIAAYRFVALNDCSTLRDAIFSRASAAGLKGTVLLAEEGINLFLAGPPIDVGAFIDWLGADARFANLDIKESRSAATPFRKLRVKVKPEIIRMDHPSIRPAGGRAATVDALTLARWLDTGRDDAGRPVVMLDTRNAFEVDQGRFHGAVDWRLSRFGEFPAAALAHRDVLADRTVVSYCTGGIRCEKAAIYLSASGVDHVLQLNGGILKYFEQVGHRHFDGHCFVFDERRGLDSSLHGCVES